MTSETRPLRFDIRRTGRSWTPEEFAIKAEWVPGRLEVVFGRVCPTLEQRLLLLGMLLENVGLDLTLRFAEPRLWTEALAARENEALRPAASLGRDMVDMARLVEMAEVSASVTDTEPPPRRTWNYRVMRFEHGEDAWEAIHEVHYEGGRLLAYSTEPAVLMWNESDGSLAALRCMERMKEALLKPVLTEADFKDVR